MCFRSATSPSRISGYVVYAALTHRPLPARWALLPVAIGSQLSDLIDKPLAYYGVLASGRTDPSPGRSPRRR